MTKREAAIVSAYTGALLGEFSDMHKYVEKILDRPVFTHEFGNKDFAIFIKIESKEDFINLTITEEEQEDA